MRSSRFNLFRLILVFTLMSAGLAEAESQPGVHSIVAAGHGSLFDSEGKAVQLNDEAYLNLYRDFARLAYEHTADQIESAQSEVMERGLEWLLSDEYSVDARLLLAAFLVEYSLNINAAFEKRYRWLQSSIAKRPLSNLADETLAIPADFESTFYLLDLESLFDALLPESYDYIEQCRSEGVPVPDYWSFDRAGPWAYQGILNGDLLSNSENTQVWTWTDDMTPGGCVALPRFSKDGTLIITGIICQAAETGNACFWDSIDRARGQLLEQQREPVALAKFQDGDMLGDCTSCHKGDNAFIIAPDDPTWQRTINQTNPNYIAGALFTTRVFPPGRFNPISSQADPAADVWWNPPANSQSHCAQACHTSSTSPGGSSYRSPPMPPACSKFHGAPWITSGSFCYQ